MAQCRNCNKEIGEGMLMCEDCSNIELDDFVAPGSFREVGTDEEAEMLRKAQEKFSQPESQERQPQASPDLVRAYQIFQEQLHPQTDLVYYPSCELDTSPTQAFPNSRVVYVDIDEKSIGILKKNGFEAVQTDSREFVPDKPVDVLILLNPGSTGTNPKKLVNRGGYILCNDWHRTATEMNSDPDFKLKGIVLKSGRQTEEQTFDQENPQEYWEEIGSDDELKTLDNGAMYKYIVRDLTLILGGDRVKDLIDQRQVVEEHGKICAKIKMDAEASGNKSGILSYEKDGRSLVLFSLPRKKGNMDDIFVFERVSSEK